MADTKISALTVSTTPLAGTEVLPIVQGGVTKQVSVANLTAGREVGMLSARYGDRGASSQVKFGQDAPTTLTLFTFDVDGGSNHGTYMIEVQFVAQQAFVVPGFATETRKYIFALRRSGAVLAASTINSEADSSYSVGNINYTMTLTPSVNVVSGTQAQFQVQVASTGLIGIGGFDWAAQAQVLGIFSVAVS